MCILNDLMVSQTKECVCNVSSQEARMMVLKKINEPDYQRVCVFFVGTVRVSYH